MKIEISTKFNIEMLILIFAIIILIFDVFYYESSYTDTYWQYNVAREILKDPSFLWKIDYRFALTGNEKATIGHPFSTFPLVFIGYASLMLLGITPEILNIIAIIIMLFIMYKTDKKAVPLLFLSFMFIRTFAFGGNDGYVALLGILCLYFFEKKPWASAVFAGLSVMVKGTGGFVFIAYILALLFFKRKYFIKGIIIALLVFSPWLIRNYLTNGDIMPVGGEITPPGLTIAEWEKIYNKTFVKGYENKTFFEYYNNQPETMWWDSTGYYPLPFDILFKIGIVFLFIDLYRKRIFDIHNIFGITYLAIYIIGQLLFGFIMPLRYYLPVIPIFALIISRNLPAKSLKIVYVICLIALLVWSYYLSKYSFDYTASQITPKVCTAIRGYVDNKPVWIEYPHQWYVLYKCNLNPGYRNEAEYTVDLINDDIRNKQNVSVIPK